MNPASRCRLRSSAVSKRPASPNHGFIEWRLLVLIGGMTSFGLAMQTTQAADYLADVIVAWTLPFGIHALLATFVLLTILLTH